MALDILGQGWNISQKGVEIITENNTINDKATLLRNALNSDLKETGSPVLSKVLNKNNVTQVVLQIQKIRNISAPKANENSHAAPRMLKLVLTDGDTYIQAIETAPVPAINRDKTPPGSKLLIHSAKISSGYLLLEASSCSLLGGQVPTLYEKWELAKSVQHHNRQNASNDGPPAWVNFGSKIQSDLQDKPFKSLDNKNPEVKENTKFDLQRQDAIAEATSGAVKKVFGGGNKPVQASVYPKARKPNEFPSKEKRVYKTKTLNVKDVEEKPQKPSERVSLFDFLEDKLPTNETGISVTPSEPTNNNYPRNQPSNKNRNSYQSYHNTKPTYNRYEPDQNNSFSRPKYEPKPQNRYEPDQNNSFTRPRYEPRPQNRYEPDQNNSFTRPKYEPKPQNRYEPDQNTFTRPKYEPKPQNRYEPDQNNSFTRPKYEPKPQNRYEPDQNTFTRPKYEPKPQNRYEPDQHNSFTRPKYEPKPQNRYEPDQNNSFTRPKYEPKPQLSQDKVEGNVEVNGLNDSFGKMSLNSQFASRSLKQHLNLGPQKKNPENVTEVVWKVGDDCVAKYWEDGKFYNANVTAITDKTCVVKFKGYGNIEEVLKNDCLPVDNEAGRKSYQTGPMEFRRNTRTYRRQ